MNIENELQKEQEAPKGAEENKEVKETQERPPVKIEDGTEMVASRESERRAAREAQEQAAKEPSVRKADPSMFKTAQPAGRVRNKHRVELCKAWIDSFNTDCGAYSANASARSIATHGMRNVFTSLDTLNRLDTKEILVHLVKTIETSVTGAWERRIVFSNLKFLPESQRELLNRMLQLFTLYAEMDNKVLIRTKSDPSYAIGLYTDGETRANIDAFFPHQK